MYKNDKKKMFIKEACVERISQAQLAEQKGANRIELCGDLSVGGITPSLEIIIEAKEKIHIPIHVMIRPRGGDFVYSDDEFEEMKNQILDCHKSKVDGVVFGILKRDNTLDIDRITVLAQIAMPMAIVFHKAIDETPNIIKALYDLIKIEGITGILTSGGKTTAKEGKVILKKIVALAKNKVEIISAGSITNDNIQKLHQFIKGPSYHGKRIVGNLNEVND